MWRLLALALLHLARTAADTSTAERIRSGQTSSFEEISRHLARAFRHEHDLRAYVSIFGAEALRAAAARDADTANGFSRGRLHGVPFAIKDLFALDGYATRAGFATAVWEAERNATAVQTLLDEGAILLGTTRLTEGAWTEYASACLADGECPPRNPFGAQLWQGDSSSGCGVGVAAGFFPFCLATDTSGSIRNPCLMNSLTCVKPRRNVLSGDGVWPLSQRLDTVGVMARTAAEVASVLGEDVDDAAASGLRLGVDWALVAAAEAESVQPTLRDAYELERGELAYPLDPKSSDAGAATLLFGGALLTLTAVVAGAFFLVLV